MAAFNKIPTKVKDYVLIAYFTVKIMPEMLRKLIPKDVNPACISTSYSHNKEKYDKALKLSEKEQIILSNLKSDGFHKCDTPLLYKLFQYYDFVHAPLEGWGTFNYKLRNIGDAVEAIVKSRNEIICNQTQDFKKISDEIVEIARVVDKELSTVTDDRFEDVVKSLLVGTFDDKYFETYITAFKEITEKATNGTTGSFEDDVLKEDEPVCFPEDYNPNVLQIPIVLSPDFKCKGKDCRTEFEYINRINFDFYKPRASKDKDGIPSSKMTLRSQKRKIDFSST